MKPPDTPKPLDPMAIAKQYAHLPLDQRPSALEIAKLYAHLPIGERPSAFTIANYLRQMPPPACPPKSPEPERAVQPPRPPAPATPQPAPLKTRWKLWRGNELANLPALRYLVTNELPERSFVIMYGQSGTGKSFLALDYAAQVAQAGRNVIYIAAEGQVGYQHRMEALTQHRNLAKDVTNIVFLFDAPDLANTAEVELLVSLLKSEYPVLIIVDTLARCMTGDENSAREMGMFIRGCDALRNALYATVMVVHHTGKSGASERGSSALRAAADVMIEVQRENDLITVECDKFKDGAEFPRRHYRREVIELAPDVSSCVLVEMDGQIASRESQQYIEDWVQILEILDTPMLRQIGCSARYLRDNAKMPTSRLYQHIQRLKNEAYVEQPAHGTYLITEAGRAFLSSPEHPPKFSPLSDTEQKELWG